MAQTAAGALKIAAAKASLSPEEYQARVDSGQKRCYKCGSWLPRDSFCSDRSRSDGLAAVCITCRNVRTAPGPTIPERKRQLALGLAWCSRCEGWLPEIEVKAGKCRTHMNAAAREHYAASPEFRHRRIVKSALSKVLAQPVPPPGVEVLLEASNGLCGYCGVNPADTFDHIIARSKGGTTTPSNVLPSCLSCNSSKKDRDLDEWMIEKGYPASSALEERLILAEAGLQG